MCYPVKIHGCKQQKYDFWSLQGSVATVLRWDDQIAVYGELFHDFARKNYQNRPMFHESIQKNKSGTVFWRQDVVSLSVKLY